MADTAHIVDLSVPVCPTHWEPEPIRRTVLGHREGADKLGRSYLYFNAGGRLRRWWARLRRPAGLFVDHRDFPDGMGLSQMTYELTTHTGTHVDAPYHYGWRQNGGTKPATITDVPLEWCYGRGVLLDFAGDEGAIDAQAVIGKLAQARHHIEAGDIVLVNTGASRYLGTREFFTRYRAVERSAVAWLVERGVRVIGTDAFSFDRPFCDMIDDYKRTGDNDHLWPVHIYGRDRPYLQIERLGNLDQLPRPSGFRVCCFPIKLQDADAAWSRVVAIFDS